VYNVHFTDAGASLCKTQSCAQPFFRRAAIAHDSIIISYCDNALRENFHAGVVFNCVRSLSSAAICISNYALKKKWGTYTPSDANDLVLHVSWARPKIIKIATLAAD
jgi:hypothetical protein